MITEFVQLVHVNNNHWVCFSSIGCVPGHVNLLNSLAQSVISREIREIKLDCGVFAIAFATCIVYGGNPCTITFDIPKMRLHLLK